MLQIARDSIEKLKKIIPQWVLVAWYAGIIYYNWFSEPQSIGIWKIFLLATVGVLIPELAIGAALFVLSALLTKVVFGDAEESALFYFISLFVATILSFLAAYYVIAYIR